MTGLFVQVNTESQKARSNPVGYIEDGMGCWIWSNAIQGAGYGTIRVGGVMWLAHRWMYECVNGPLRDGVDLDHLCRNRACVNPAHLRACTRRENIFAAGSLSIAVLHANKTACPQGHEYTVDNIYMYENRRYCRACHRVRQARRYSKIS